MRVGVLGATGRMGRATCEAVLAAPDLELAAAVGRATGVGRPLRELVPAAPEGLQVGESLSDLLAAEAEVVVDFSRPEATAAAVEGLLSEGVHLVSGTTGLPTQVMDDLANLAGKADHGNAVWAPNFALGAVLAMHFAAVAGRFYPAAEVIELLLGMIEADVVPVVPSKGSVGSSGDLAPLAHIALVLVGEGGG